VILESWTAFKLAGVTYYFLETKEIAIFAVEGGYCAMLREGTQVWAAVAGPAAETAKEALKVKLHRSYPRLRWERNGLIIRRNGGQYTVSDSGYTAIGKTEDEALERYLNISATLQRLVEEHGLGIIVTKDGASFRVICAAGRLNYLVRWVDGTMDEMRRDSRGWRKVDED
jgi:hypothetical protein